MSSKEFLMDKFGKSFPEQSELDTWREAEITAFLASPLYACRTAIMIPDKRGQLVNLNPWNGQLALAIAMNSQRKRGLRQQIVEIKPRQIGATSFLLANTLWRAMHPNQRCTIMVTDKAVADELSHRLATMYNNLPPHLRPMKRVSNLQFVIFDNPNMADRALNPGLNSTISISMPSAERGRTPHMVVASEFAFWKTELQVEFTTGLVSAMPMDDSACVVIDTTPNGHDDVYEPLVMEAIENNPNWVKKWGQIAGITREQILAGALGEPDRPDAGFLPWFWPWYSHESYCTKDESEFGELPKMKSKDLQHLQATVGKVEKYGGEEEKDLQKMYNLSWSRLQWRRRKIDSYKQPDIRTRLITFRQEFASDYQSCFVDLNHTPFDPVAMDMLLARGKQPAARGILRKGENGPILDTTWRSQFMEWRIYAPPEGTEKYVLGMDTAYAYESEDSDAHAIQIIRERDLKQVAVFEGRVPDHKVQEQLYLGWLWYNRPYYAIETANNGYGLVRSSMDMGMENTYYWKRLDRDILEESKFPGWQTDGRTRPVMENALLELICNRNPDDEPEPLIQIPDIPTLQQLAAVKRTPSDSIKNEQGHDDLVDALMIACAIRKDAFYPNQSRSKARERTEANYLVDRFANKALMPNQAARYTRNHPNLESL
jgi:hypothetical protein